ncbi:MAG: DNA-directed DNA polymerase II small subunit [Candidatus Methanomethylicia archaeon]|nr:DNA-directed DNA polymerase II small subunit [Candidatus Methanomethylicia archaeon]MCX8169097.1 DNA-directed DNA polymerase II small subunit [Candidatus Methanomethylicia archaeon]MDW7988829.1 DNA-directed DNA polymerase II small subunit [Nitrososphaerota archaeon]
MTIQNTNILKIKTLLTKLSLLGVQVSPEVFELLYKRDDITKMLEEKVINYLLITKEKPAILTLEILYSLLKTETCENETTDASHMPDEIEIIFEPTEYILSKSLSIDFKNYFMSRYTKLRKILLTERFDTKGFIDIYDIASYKNYSIHQERNTVKIICIVSDKLISKNHILFEVEDLTGEISVIVTKKNENLIRRARNILPNEVICIEGFITDEGKIIATDILQPEVTQPSINIGKKPDLYALLISDLHIGSKYFMRTEFNRLILWLNGFLGDEKMKRLARKVKYLVVAGDVVDGIGIYPNQEEELVIKDLKKQYDIAAHYFSQIPQHIKIFLIPGNHDAARQTLPSTKLYKEYAASLYRLNNVIILGDPVYFKLHDSLFLVTHGRSLDDIIVSIPELKYEAPAKAMVELLKRRHLAPVYGNRTLIAPEEEDYMVIEKIPHVFHAGHIHTFECIYYKGIVVVNSGTWQRQTEHMKKMGIQPNPAKAVLINLGNNTVQAIINFIEENVKEEKSEGHEGL